MMSKMGFHTGVAVAICLLSFAVPAVAHQITDWSLSVGNWSDPTAWTSGEPLLSSYAEVTNGGIAIVTNLDESCGNLFISGAGSTVDVSGGSLGIYRYSDETFGSLYVTDGGMMAVRAGGILRSESAFAGANGVLNVSDPQSRVELLRDLYLSATDTELSIANGAQVDIGGTMYLDGGCEVRLADGQLNVGGKIQMSETDTLTLTGGTLACEYVEAPNGGDIVCLSGTSTIEAETFLGENVRFTIDGPDAPTLQLNTQQAGLGLVLGVGVYDAGTLNTTSDMGAQYIAIGLYDGSHGTINLSGGSLYCQRRLFVGSIGEPSSGGGGYTGGVIMTSSPLMPADPQANGVLNLTGGATVFADEVAISATGAILVSDGLLTAEYVDNDGWLVLDSGSVATATYEYAQGPTGVLGIEISGQAVGEFATLSTWELVLDGTLELSFTDGFVPQVGMTFDILDWAVDPVDGFVDEEWADQFLTGQFAQIVSPEWVTWDTSMLYTTGQITVSSVPEPATLGLLALGAAALLRRRR